VRKLDRTFKNRGTKWAAADGSDFTVPIEPSVADWKSIKNYLQNELHFAT